MNNKIKLCPFCGAKPTISKVWIDAEIIIGCNNKNCKVNPSFSVQAKCIEQKGDSPVFFPEFDEAEKKAIAIWNYREETESDFLLSKYQNFNKWLFDKYFEQLVESDLWEQFAAYDTNADEDKKPLFNSLAEYDAYQKPILQANEDADMLLKMLFNQGMELAELKAMSAKLAAALNSSKNYIYTHASVEKCKEIDTLLSEYDKINNHE